MDLRIASGRAAVLASVALFFGCAGNQVMRLDRAQRPPTDPMQVQVLVEAPSRPHAAIALVTVDDLGLGLSLNTLKSEMVKEAAKLGGDAVILGQQSRSVTGATFIPVGKTWHAVPETTTTLVGSVIVFTDK